jgi:hypothetical protein
MPTLLPDRLLRNITILVPNGTTQHGNERILCLPITSHYWPSISAVIVFFAANFLAHAATVKSSPGDATHVQACNAFLALLFPMSGLLRALNAILRYSRVAKTELDKACNAGALCMVVRGRHWRPKDSENLRIGVVHRLQEKEEEEEEDETEPINADLVTYLPAYAREKPSRWVHFDSVWAQSYVDTGMKRIHGTFTLPEGYAFAVIPRDTILISKADAPDGKDATNDLSASKSILKAIASMVQIVSAFITLLLHRSDLITRWGYASYHLTVIPYLFMTLVNLVGNLCIADYPCLYMVRTETMDEAEKIGGVFEGEVAQTITIMDANDDLVEDLPYSGLTDEDIISFATNHLFINYWMDRLLWYILRSTRKVAHPPIPSTIESIDLHIVGVARAPTSDQPSTVSDPTPIVSDEQIDPVGGSNASPSSHEEAEDGFEMHAVEECNNEKEPEFRFVEAVSSSSRYRIRVYGQPQRSPFYEIRRLRRYTFHDRVKRSRRLPDSHGRPAFTWSLMLISRHDIRIAWLERYAVAVENQFKPSYLTRFYYPSCSRFLRTSSSNHHTTLRTGVPSYGSPPALASGQHTRTFRNNRNSHTRWGVLLEIVVGLFLVGIFFSVIAALTRFQSGQSSTTERGIMMAWLASGLYGFCLPFMSTSELLRVFFLLPLVSVIDLALAWMMKPMGRLGTLHRGGPIYLPAGMETICSFLPLAMFIPPIWGFVLVGRMLVEWGNCIRLY